LAQLPAFQPLRLVGRIVSFLLLLSRKTSRYRRSSQRAIVCNLHLTDCERSANGYPVKFTVLNDSSLSIEFFGVVKERYIRIDD